jgi:hypothetical protein
MTNIEYADRSRGDGTFPGGWGQPPRDEEQRAAWILEHVRSDQADPVRALARLRRRYLTKTEIEGRERQSSPTSDREAWLASAFLSAP